MIRVHHTEQKASNVSRSLVFSPCVFVCWTVRVNLFLSVSYYCLKNVSATLRYIDSYSCSEHRKTTSFHKSTFHRNRYEKLRDLKIYDSSWRDVTSQPPEPRGRESFPKIVRPNWSSAWLLTVDHSSTTAAIAKKMYLAFVKTKTQRLEKLLRAIVPAQGRPSSFQESVRCYLLLSPRGVRAPLFYVFVGTWQKD